MEKFTAYQGKKFVVEWFFDKNGNSQAKEYYQELNEVDQAKVMILFKRICEFGKIFDKTKFRYEGDGIYAFKPQPDRFLSFFQKGKKVIVTNAFRKKQDKLPNSEKRRAVKSKENYLKQVKQGEYYEE